MPRFNRPRRPSKWPTVFGAIAAVLFAFTATTVFLFLNNRNGLQHRTTDKVEIVRGTGELANPINSSGRIEVIDGDTVRMGGNSYRLVGFDTPERGDLAKCDDERRRADAATLRLRALLADGRPSLKRVACACRAGTEGTRVCNYGRLCASLSINGLDVGDILISEELARPFVCGATRCPKRRPWC